MAETFICWSELIIDSVLELSLTSSCLCWKDVNINEGDQQMESMKSEQLLHL